MERRLRLQVELVHPLRLPDATVIELQGRGADGREPRVRGHDVLVAGLAADVHVTQNAEIARMRELLAGL